MFYGMVLVCGLGVSEYTNETCKLYNSPNVYNTNEECVNAIQQFLVHPGVAAMLEAGNEVINVECHNVVPEDKRGVKS
jgi:hypothetical protein